MAQENEYISDAAETLLQSNQDLKIRSYCEAVEEARKVRRGLERQVAEKDEALAEKNEVIAKKDEVIAEKDAEIAEKNEALAEKDEAIAEKDAEIARLAALLKARKED